MYKVCYLVFAKELFLLPLLWVRHSTRCRVHCPSSRLTVCSLISTLISMLIKNKRFLGVIGRTLVYSHVGSGRLSES